MSTNIFSPSPTDFSTTPNRNLVLNGAMVWDQKNEGNVYSSTGTEVYSLDQWRFVGSGASGVFSIQRVASSAPGFPFSLNMVVTTQQASLAATDNFHLEHPIEGSRIGCLKYGTANAVTTNLSFWARASTTGNYSVSLMEGTNSRSYVTTFNIAVANTWEYKTILIPGDTSGTYQTADSTFGLKIIWSLGVGSTYSTATSETWQGAAYWNKTGSNQLIQQANGNNLYITGVQFEIGSFPTAFEYLFPSQELQLLRRYYYKTFPKGTAVAQNAGRNGYIAYISQLAGVNGNSVMVKYPVTMASATPTITTYNPSAANALWRSNAGGGTDSGAITVFFDSCDGFIAYNPQVAGQLPGEIIGIHFTSNARLGGG